MASNYSPKIVTDGLVLCLDAADKVSYPGSGTTLTDLSGNGIDGTLSHASIGTDTSGTMDFDGSTDYVSVTMPSVGPSLTIASWVNPDVDTGGDNYKAIFDWLGGADFIFGYRNNKIAQYSYQSDLLYSDTDLTVGGWNYIVLTRTASVVTFYLNGVADGGDSTSTRTPSGVAHIGSRSGTTYEFDGKIAILRVYDRVLSAKEISQNFNAQRSRFGV